MSINHPSGAKDYPVYTRKEADSKGIRYVPWKDAEEGDFALSDDDYCAEVLRTAEYSDGRKGKNKYLRTPWGYFMWNPKYDSRKFLVKGRKSAYTMDGGSRMDSLCKNDTMKNLAMMFALTMNKDFAVDRVLGTHTDKEHHKYLRMMRTKEFKNLVRDELQALLQEHGMTEKYTLDLLTEVIGMAKDKKDITNLMRAVDNLQEMHGMKEKLKSTTTTQIEASQTRRMIDEIAEEERKLLATEVKVEEVHESSESQETIGKAKEQEELEERELGGQDEEQVS